MERSEWAKEARGIDSIIDVTDEMIEDFKRYTFGMDTESKARLLGKAQLRLLAEKWGELESKAELNFARTGYMTQIVGSLYIKPQGNPHNPRRIFWKGIVRDGLNREECKNILMDYWGEYNREEIMVAIEGVKT